jgi:diguanylate cyclase (GGDEF)-like protein
MTLLRPVEALAPGGDVRVLLVEDSAAEAELAEESLREALPGTTVTRCASLAEARIALAESRYDAALLDLGLPDSTGLEALMGLRTGWPDLPLVVLTGNPEAAVARKAMAAGAQDFLLKSSVDGPALGRAVQHAVDRARFEQATAQYERLARSLLDAMEAPTCAVDSEGVIMAVNAAWQRFAMDNGADPGSTGEGARYLATGRLGPPVHDADARAVTAGLEDVLRGVRTRYERDYPCADGSGRWFSVRITPMHGTAGAVVSHVDITAVKQAEDEAQHRALHDGLTGLPNRRLLQDRLDQALSEASRHGTVVAVAFLDLDHFKRVNDSLGHAAGDALLIAVAERLGRRLRAGDTLARVSGDEFVVVWRDVAGVDEAEALTGRLQDGLREPLEVDDTALSVTASIGLVVGHPPQTGAELLAAADAAMYDAKARGRARQRLYGPDLHELTVQRSETSADLQEALARDELVLHYQPVVNLTTGSVVGVEALVRWQHPQRGLLGPESFLPIAEATGLVVPLGQQVLRLACAEAATWPEGRGVGLDVEVNLSVRQVTHPDTVRIVREALEDSGLPPHRLVIDVTESAVMEDAGAARSVLHDLAALGTRIAVDDFGTGFSSLQHLTRYPVGVLKVDRSFVAGMGLNPDDDAIVSSVVGLAHAVGARCVAEGVETAEQATTLRMRGCELAQGNLFSPPVPATELPRAIDLSRAAAFPLTGTGLPVETPPDPEVLGRIRSLHATGASLHTIAAALNRSGAPHPAGLRWHARAVARALSDVVEGAYLVISGDLSVEQDRQGRIPRPRGAGAPEPSTS